MRRNPFDFAGRSAYLYCRVSTADQAEHGTSLADQRALLTSWADRSGVTIAGVHVDDKSAKASDEVGASFTRRPAWSALVAAINARPPAGGGPDLVVVKDWSRFGRDTASALLVTAQLRELGVEVQAVTQLVDYSSPTALFQVLIPMATAEVENRQRSINVKRGMRRALKEGRWVAKPPVGYVRVKSDGKSFIAPDPETGPLVSAAFEIAADGVLPIAEVYRRAKANGLHVARSRFYKMLQDESYLGRIHLDAWEEMGEPAEVIHALHAPLVSELTFARVQRRFDPDRASRRRMGERGPNPAFPLRGVLLCPRCGLPVTTDLSKGRNGTRYSYYVCHRHRAEPAAVRFRYRHPTADVHGALAETLGRVQISPAARALAVAMAEESEGTSRAERRRRRTRLEAQLAEATERRDRAEDAFADGSLAADVFTRMSARYEAEIARLDGEVAGLRGYDVSAEAERVRVATELMTDLRGIWERAAEAGDEGADAQAALAGSIYPDGAVFSEGAFRTAVPSPLIHLLGGKRAENGTTDPLAEAGRPVGYAREDSNLWPLVPETNALSN